MADFFNLPPGSMISEVDNSDSNGWEMIMTYDSIVDASIVKGALESEGIPCFVSDESPYAGLLSVRLWVPRSDVDRALMIMRRNHDD